MSCISISKLLTMRKTFLVVLFFWTIRSFGQNPTPESLGFRHIQTIFKNDTVNILIKSKVGDEFVTKPLFLFIQGSLPRPLIILNGRTHAFSVFPFKLDSLLQKYHVAIIGKPFIPLIVDQKYLSKEMNFVDAKTNEFPAGYTNNNYLDYYVQRDKSVIRFLQKKPWVSKKELVVAGHSEGSTVAAKLANVCKSVTQLIYLSGNPFGRIMSIIAKSRSVETDTNKLAENDFNYWQNIVKDPHDMNDQGDTHKATYQFSLPPIQYLEKLSIPVLVAYGTKDYCSPYNDFLRVHMITQKKNNFTFNAYIGLDHNFFPSDKTGTPNYDVYNWDIVGLEMYRWLLTK